MADMLALPGYLFPIQLQCRSAQGSRRCCAATQRRSAQRCIRASRSGLRMPSSSSSSSSWRCCAATSSSSSASVAEDEVGPSSSSSSYGDVYVASVPITAPRGPVQWLLQAADEIDFATDFQHFMTVIQPAAGDGNSSPCTVLDFQPCSPEDPMAAVAVLMGGTIPGVLQERTLSRIPSRRCWWVGKMKPGLDVGDAVTFNRRYNPELSMGINDCRHHTLDLVEYLTGKRLSHIEDVRNVRTREFEALGEEREEEEGASADEEPPAEAAEETRVEASAESSR